MAAEADERVGGAEDIELSFYTAGTGDSGAAIVAATFLLLQEEPRIYAGGERAKRRDAGGSAAALRPWDDPRVVDFGGPLPREGTTVWTLDNPETETVHRALGTPNISSRFATAPGIWNLLFLATRLLVPARLLADRGFELGPNWLGENYFCDSALRCDDVCTTAEECDAACGAGGENGNRQFINGESGRQCRRKGKGRGRRPFRPPGLTGVRWTRGR